MAYARRSCGCYTSEGYEQALKDAKRNYRKIYIVTYFGRCCAQCVNVSDRSYDIYTDYTFEDMELVHGITLQTTHNIFCAVGSPIDSPVVKYVRYTDQNTSHDLKQYANSLSDILNALASITNNGSIVCIHGLDDKVLVLSKQSFVLGSP